MVKTLAQSYDEFCARVAHMAPHDPTPDAAEVDAMILAIGLLIGAGFPREAAYMAHSMSAMFPTHVFPWIPK